MKPLTTEEIEDITEKAIASVEKNLKILISYQSMLVKYTDNKFDVVYFKGVSFDTTYYGTFMIPKWCFDLSSDYMATDLGYKEPAEVISIKTRMLLRVAYWIYYTAKRVLKKGK